MNYITWLYFLVKNPKIDKEVIFLYGLTLPTESDEQSTEISSEKIDNNHQIVLFRTIAATHPNPDTTIINFNGFIHTQQHTSNLLGNKKIIEVTQDVYQNIPSSIVVTPIHVACYFTDDFYKYYEKQQLNENTDFLIEIAKTLEKISGQPFSKAYAKRFGCYEIGTPQSWVEEIVTPFDIAIEKTENTIVYKLKIDDTYQFEQITIHLINYNDENEVISDFIKTVTKNQRETFLIEINKKDHSSGEYWVFDQNGMLLDRNRLSYIKSIAFNMNLLGGTYNIGSSTYSSKSPLRGENRSFGTYSGSSNIIDDPNNKENVSEQMSNLLFHQINSDSNKKIYDNGAWFSKGEVNEIITFLNYITRNSTYKVTFIDPYISSSASFDYLYHFENTQLSLKFISCWEKDISPDDSEKIQENSKSIEELQSHFDAIQDYAIPLRSATWYNLESKEFHDRFILVENTVTAEKQVYSMSNSLNNMLKKYDLLIVPLHGNVLKKAVKHIEVLENKCIEEKQIYPRKKQSNQELSEKSILRAIKDIFQKVRKNVTNFWRCSNAGHMQRKK